MTLTPAREYAADALLRDGSSVHVRAIRADDKLRLLEHFKSLSPESVRNRFFAAKSALTDRELKDLTEVDFLRHVALAAVRWEEGRERFIGVARYIRCDEEPGGERRADLGVAVTDSYQGRGVGTVLLEHLAGIALRNGITEIEADVLGGNIRMLELLTHSGFLVRDSGAGRVVHCIVPLDWTDQAVARSDQRAFAAAAASMHPLFNPRSVAVVGASASARTTSLGSVILGNLKAHGFKGEIHPIHPEAAQLQGLRAWRRVSDIPGGVDLVVVSVPAPAVEAVVEDAARAGARGMVVISAGFAEVGEEGRKAQERIRLLVRESGMRLVGPNCMGMLNTDPAVSVDATFSPVFPPPGNVAFLSQSGALGLAILEHARALELGISSFVSVGNKADVSGNDVLAYWKDDPRTDVIALYLESFGNPRRFARLAPEVARHKPIVAVKSGRSAAGTRAATSHSAALACLDVAVDALFEQAGVIRTDTLEDLFDVVSLLATQPPPKGPRVGVVTNAGGPGILLADACEAQGLAVPELSEETRAALRAFLLPEASLRNPVDMIAPASPNDYERAIITVGADPSVDAVVAIYVPPQVTNPDEVAAAIVRGADALPDHKPVLSVFLASRSAPAVLATGARGRIPTFRFPENAARALAAAHRYARWRARPRGIALRLDPPVRDAIRSVIAEALQGSAGPLWLTPAQVEEVLRQAGVEVAASRVVRAEDAPAAAEEMGYPLVAKAVAPGLVHKSDVGAVILDLHGAEDVRAAVATLGTRVTAAGHAMTGVQLQQQVRGGIEALVGVVGDPTFGPLVVCGLGGIQVELLRDAAFRLVPVTDRDAADMIDRLRLRPLLDGYRGAPPGDREALARLIQRVSALVDAVPEIQELDLNPVKVLTPGEGAVVVDARICVERVSTPNGVAAAH